VRVRRCADLRVREDEFGGICYVGHRDDFFAVTRQVFLIIRALKREWMEATPSLVDGYRSLARLGMCETTEPRTREEAYSGVSLVGEFPELPTVSQTLVLNLFASAHCPLKCIYCHADDLMQPGDREGETEEDLDNVVATASMIPAMVAVITGGDPLTRPNRARTLIERIGKTKGLVLDTAGVGDVGGLLGPLKENGVHVRVSLDSENPNINSAFRPGNPHYVKESHPSYYGAERTIDACLKAGIPVTVQTVITRRNDQLSGWRNLRDWLVTKGVKHWVLHVAVRGGKAREVEERAAKQRRPRRLVPGPEIHSKLWDFISDTIAHGLPIDIRCTDTDNTPNSVLLVGSRGDLFTEGLAHHGKVQLFAAGRAAPDKVNDLMVHVDRFGHARRYLNWNPWFHDGKSIEEICYRAPVPSAGVATVSGIVETEAKVRVVNVKVLVSRLARSGYVSKGRILQRDEYYDDALGSARRSDFVIRIRTESGKCKVAFKGPRFFTPEGENSRLEFEVPCGEADQVRDALQKRDLMCTWCFEKRREMFVHPERRVQIVIDEIPEVGFFLEIEGALAEVRALREALGDALAEVERRNYKELFVDFKKSLGESVEGLKGAEFSP